MTEKLNASTLPWYRHPWPWILMAGPAIVVVAGVATAYLAFSSSDGLVADDYYKQGLTVNQTTARDRRALELGLHAALSVAGDGKSVQLALAAAPGVDLPEMLILHVTHPTRSGLDRRLPLMRDPQIRSERDNPKARYTSPPDPAFAPLSGRWRVVLEDARKEWRLADDWRIDTVPVLRLP